MIHVQKPKFARYSFTSLDGGFPSNLSEITAGVWDFHLDDLLLRALHKEVGHAAYLMPIDNSGSYIDVVNGCYYLRRIQKFGKKRVSTGKQKVSSRGLLTNEYRVVRPSQVVVTYYKVPVKNVSWLDLHAKGFDLIFKAV